jgi:hypothetical protein
MKRILLAMPLFLVIGLAFVDLPSGNTSSSNISPTSVVSAPAADKSTAQVQNPNLPDQKASQNNTVKSKTVLGGGIPNSFDEDDEGAENDD